MSSKRRISIGIASDLLGSWESRAKKMKSFHLEQTLEEVGKEEDDRNVTVLSTIKEEESVRRTPYPIFTPPVEDQSPFQFEALREEDEFAQCQDLDKLLQKTTPPIQVQSSKKNTPRCNSNNINKQQEQSVKVQLRLAPLFPNSTDEQVVQVHFRFLQHEKLIFSTPKFEKSCNSQKEEKSTRQQISPVNQQVYFTPKQNNLSPQNKGNVVNVENVNNVHFGDKECGVVYNEDEGNTMKGGLVVNTDESYEKVCQKIGEEQNEDMHMEIQENVVGIDEKNTETNQENGNIQKEDENQEMQEAVEKQHDEETYKSCEKDCVQENQSVCEQQEQQIFFSAEKVSQTSQHPSPIPAKISTPITSDPSSPPANQQITHQLELHNQQQKETILQNENENQITTPRINLQNNSSTKQLNSKSEQKQQKEQVFQDENKNTQKQLDFQQNDTNLGQQVDGNSDAFQDQNKSAQKQLIDNLNQQVQNKNTDVILDQQIDQLQNRQKNLQHDTEDESNIHISYKQNEPFSNPLNQQQETCGENSNIDVNLTQQQIDQQQEKNEIIPNNKNDGGMLQNSVEKQFQKVEDRQITQQTENIALQKTNEYQLNDSEIAQMQQMQQPTQNNQNNEFQNLEDKLQNIEKSPQQQQSQMQQPTQQVENISLQNSIEKPKIQENSVICKVVQNNENMQLQNSTENLEKNEIQEPKQAFQSSKTDKISKSVEKYSKNDETQQMQQLSTPRIQNIAKLNENTLKISKSASLSSKNKRQNSNAGNTTLTPNMRQIQLSDKDKIFSSLTTPGVQKARSKSCSSSFRRIIVNQSPYHFSDFDSRVEGVKKLSLTPIAVKIDQTPISASDLNIKKVENNENQQQSGRSSGRYRTRSQQRSRRRRRSSRLSGGSRSNRSGGVTHLDMEEDIQKVLKDIGQNVLHDRKGSIEQSLSRQQRKQTVDSDHDVIMEPAEDFQDDFRSEYRRVSMLDPMYKEQAYLLQQENMELKQKAWEYYEWGDKLNQQLNQRFQLKNKLEVEIQQLNQKISNMETQQAEREEHFQQSQECLHQQLQQNKSVVEQMQREVQEGERKIQDAQQVIVAKDLVVNDIQQKLAELHSQKAKIEQQVGQLQQAIKEKDEKLNKYRTMIFEFREENKKFDDRHQVDKQKIKQLSAEVDRCKGNMVTLQQTLKDNRIQPPILK